MQDENIAKHLDVAKVDLDEQEGTVPHVQNLTARMMNKL